MKGSSESYRMDSASKHDLLVKCKSERSFKLSTLYSSLRSRDPKD